MHCCIVCISAISHSLTRQGRHPLKCHTSGVLAELGKKRIKMRDEPIIGKDNVPDILFCQHFYIINKCFSVSRKDCFNMPVFLINIRQESKPVFCVYQ